jgi:hypothetical protein
VISQTTTFYPVELDEATRQSTDNMSRYTTADDAFVVIQRWWVIIFFIQSHDAKFQDMKRPQFGAKFDSALRRNILLQNRVVVVQYVDAYLSACDSDCIGAVNAVRPEHCFPELVDRFLDESSRLLPEFDLNLLSCVMFQAYRPVARFTAPEAVRFDPETFAMLSVFERVEYESVGEPQHRHFSSASVTSADEAQNDFSEN